MPQHTESPLPRPCVHLCRTSMHEKQPQSNPLPPLPLPPKPTISMQGSQNNKRVVEKVSIHPQAMKWVNTLSTNKEGRMLAPERRNEVFRLTGRSILEQMELCPNTTYLHLLFWAQPSPVQAHFSAHHLEVS